MTTYIGTTDLKTYLGITGTVDDGLLLTCIQNASQAIDTYTRRHFGTTQGTQYYNRFHQDRGVRGQALYTDTDFVALIAVQNGDGQAIPVGSVWLEPRNEGPPYRILHLKSSYVWNWNTDADVIVTAAWGYGTSVPDDIVQATTRLAAHLYRQKDVGPADVSGFDQAGTLNIPKGMPDDVRLAIFPYRSRSGGAIG